VTAETKTAKHMTNLKSTIPKPQSELDYIARYRYKYTHPKTPVYILAFYMRRYDNDTDEEGKSVVEWSLYHYDNEQPLLEQINTLMEDFTNMINSAGWED
jgi:hypothetical protein